MFFAFGRPWFVAAAYAVHKLTQPRSSPVQPTKPQPEFLHKLCDTSGVTRSKPILMSAAFAEQQNKKLIREAPGLLWIPERFAKLEPAKPQVPNPMGLPLYRLFSATTGDFVLDSAVPMKKELADELNAGLTKQLSPLRWIEEGCGYLAQDAENN